MNYKTYAEAKIANPDCEIVTTGKNWEFEKSLKGVFQALGDSDSLRHSIGDDAWVICQPTDYCPTLKEFLEAGHKLVKGDYLVNMWGVAGVAAGFSDDNVPDDNDSKRYILSATALDGGCKISAKADSWSIHSNTLPLCELTDEQYGKMRRSHDSGSQVEFANVTNGFEFEVIDNPRWCKDQVYRIKQKSERELFIDKSVQLMTSETERTMEQMFGAQFDAGARYSDLTKHFGENI